ncbi:hypothetical protein WNY37_17295 [Henriciella sp. AS95]|uniref:hypothetical protein n=1 Tax=Henriciella sp. AS95 TaxID=3135782 RepID=UPI0031710B68
MLLRRLSKNVKDQNWFAVVLDFLIVVAGILIAFQITSWNEQRQARAELAEAEAAIRSDLLLNYVWAKERISLRDCRVQGLGELSERLLEPGETWTGMPLEQDEQGKARAIEQVLRSPNRPWTDRVWKAELARGVLNGMDPIRRSDLDFVFKQAGDIFEHQTKITDLQSRLKILSKSVELPQSDRLRYLDIVSELDEHGFWTELKASQLCAMIELQELDFDEEELALLRERAGAVLDYELRRSQYGDCVKPVTITNLETGGASSSGGGVTCDISGYN